MFFTNFIICQDFSHTKWYDEWSIVVIFGCSKLVLWVIVYYYSASVVRFCVLLQFLVLSFWASISDYFSIYLCVLSPFLTILSMIEHVLFSHPHQMYFFKNGNFALVKTKKNDIFLRMIYVFTSHLMSKTFKTKNFINLKSELAGILKNAMSVMYTRFFFQPV